MMVRCWDLGDVTIMPGLVDAWSAIGQALESGSAILAYGVTTIVTDEADPAFDPIAWEGEQTPGPRVITIDSAGQRIGRTQYRRFRRRGNSLADRFTTGTVLRPYGFAAEDGSLHRRPCKASPARSSVGSKPNRLAAGIGLHAELLALTEAGLSGEQALHAAGRNAAKALGLEFQLGTPYPRGRGRPRAGARGPAWPHPG